MVLQTIITGIVCLLLGIGGGYIWGTYNGYNKLKNEITNMKPKNLTVHNISTINSKFYIDNNNRNDTKIFQGQVTTIFNDAITNQVVNIDLKDITNVSFSFSEVTNYYESSTNNIVYTNYYESLTNENTLTN